MRPVAQTDGHDFSGHIDEFVPCVTAMIEDVVVGLKIRFDSQLSNCELPVLSSCNVPHGRFDTARPRSPWGTSKNIRLWYNDRRSWSRHGQIVRFSASDWTL